MPQIDIVDVTSGLPSHLDQKTISTIPSSTLDDDADATAGPSLAQSSHENSQITDDSHDLLETVIGAAESASSLRQKPSSKSAVSKSAASPPTVESDDDRESSRKGAPSSRNFFNHVSRIFKGDGPATPEEPMFAKAAENDEEHDDEGDDENDENHEADRQGEKEDDQQNTEEEDFKAIVKKETKANKPAPRITRGAQATASANTEPRGTRESSSRAGGVRIKAGKLFVWTVFEASRRLSRYCLFKYHLHRR